MYFETLTRVHRISLTIAHVLWPVCLVAITIRLIVVLVKGQEIEWLGEVVYPLYGIACVYDVSRASSGRPLRDVTRVHRIQAILGVLWPVGLAAITIRLIVVLIAGQDIDWVVEVLGPISVVISAVRYWARDSSARPPHPEGRKRRDPPAHGRLAA